MLSIVFLLVTKGGETADIAAEGTAEVEGGTEQQSQADCGAGETCREDKTSSEGGA